MKHLTQTPRPIKDTRKDIREEVTDIIERCMEKEPENRFQDTDEILEILKTIKTRGAEATLIKREMQAMVPEEKSTDTYRLKDSEKVIFP